MAGGVVVDNSVVMGWCFEGEDDVYPLAVLKTLMDGVAHQPSVWPLEVGNALLVAQRRQRISHAEIAEFLELLDNMTIEIESESPKRMLTEILGLAREHQLSTYDASYLDLAMRKGLPLATQDRSLRRAAAKCGVALFKP